MLRPRSKGLLFDAVSPEANPLLVLCSWPSSVMPRVMRLDSQLEPGPPLFIEACSRSIEPGRTYASSSLWSKTSFSFKLQSSLVLEEGFR